jgi:hypothetical protein
VKVEISILIAIYNFPVAMFIKRPDGGSQLQLKHVDVNKLIKTGVVCDCFDTYNCDLLYVFCSFTFTVTYTLMVHNPCNRDRCN